MYYDGCLLFLVDVAGIEKKTLFLPLGSALKNIRLME
jgi:hypothetical protein